MPFYIVEVNYIGNSLYAVGIFDDIEKAKSYAERALQHLYPGRTLGEWEETANVFMGVQLPMISAKLDQRWGVSITTWEMNAGLPNL